MAKKKEEHFYYVMVCSGLGPVFVTSINYSDNTARWDDDKKPLAMSKDNAEYIVLGLLWHGTNAYMVDSKIELDNQPYNYADYEIEFKKKEN